MNPVFYILLSLTFSLQTAAQNRLYVNLSANGQNNGQSWTDAFNSLHDALALAEASDEIWVAGGIYRPSATGDRSARFEMLSGVKIYGGFAGTELDLSERDWQSHPSIFDGDIGTVGDSTDNSYNLLYLYRPDSLTLVDGFIFRHAFANDNTAQAGEPGSSGAALYIMAQDGEAYPVIRNCTLEHNTALKHGGAVYVNGGGSGSVAPMFDNCRFTANRAIVGNGGALYRNGGSWVDRLEDIKGCVFERNLANLQGGAVYFADSPRSDIFDIVQTLFFQNQIIVTFPTQLIHTGTALFVTLARSNGATMVSLRQSKIANQKRIILTAPAQSYSTSIATYPQGFEVGNLIFNFDSVYFEQNINTCGGESFGWSRFLISNSTFYKDTVSTGISTIDAVDFDTSKVTNTKFLYSVGGITSGSSTLYLESVTCAYNRNVGFGMFPLRANAEIIANNLVAYGNTHSYFNSGIVNKSGIFLSPGTIWQGLWKGTVRISNSSAYDNLIAVGYTYNTNNTVEYKNNSFYLQESQYAPYNSFIAYSEAALFEHNIINLPDTLNSPVWIKTGNIWNTDPQFINPDSGDLRLSPCSAARNAGNNAAVLTATDISGASRIQDGTVDIGAYETPAFSLATEPDIKAACAGQPDGAIIAPLLSACEPLAVAWQSGAQSGTSLDNLSPGSYAVTMTDAQGRSLSFVATVPVASPPTFQVDGSPVSCFGAMDAMLAVMPLSGKPPYAYLWSPSGDTDSVAVGLSPGPVSVTVTDDWGCTASFSFVVQQPDTLQFAATVTNASTTQSADGSILVNNVTGGTAPYDYLWEPGGSTGDMLTGLNPGLYTLTVTDARGCEAVWTFEVKAVLGTGEAEGKTMLLWPNPAHDVVQLGLPATTVSERRVELADMSGKKVLEQSLPAGEGIFSLNVGSLPSGTYHLMVKENGQVAYATKLLRL